MNSHFVNSLLDLVGLQPFIIYGDDEMAATADSMVRTLVPSWRYGGRVGDLEQLAHYQDHFIVLVAVDWEQSWQELLAQGIGEERLLVWTPPTGDRWGYYLFLKDILHEIGHGAPGDDNQLPLTAEAHINRATLLRRTMAFFTNMFKPLTFPEEVPQVQEWKVYHPFFAEQVAKNLVAIHGVANRLSDAQSRKLYLSLFGWGITAIVDYRTPRLLQHVQYFDHIDLQPGDVLLNVGVYTGSEIPGFWCQIRPDGMIHNVDPMGYNHLSAAARRVVESNPHHIHLHEVALHNREGDIEFLLVGQQAIAPDFIRKKEEFAASPFPCVTIEKLVNAVIGLERLDLIKIDIEGAEEYILEGVLSLMEQFRPQVAISIYHEVYQYWTIPKYFMDRASDYKFYLQHYSFGRFETILYMIPTELSPS